MKPIVGVRDLALAATIVIALSRFVDGPLAWLMAVVLLVATALGTLQIIGSGDAVASTAGVPIESLLPPALAVVAWFIERVVTSEARLARATTPPSRSDRTEILVNGLVAAFGAFIGIAALAAGGITATGGGVPPASSGPFELGGLAVADGLIAFLLGYRIAALRSSVVRDVAWMASTAAAVVTITAALLRQIEIPGLLGPALLVLVLFLWDALHGSSPARRRDPRRIAETVLLVVLGLVIVGWSIGLRA
jgi:hypothetical protein